MANYQGKGRKVYQYEGGVLVAEYQTITAASSATGISKASIFNGAMHEKPVKGILFTFDEL